MKGGYLHALYVWRSGSGNSDDRNFRLSYARTMDMKNWTHAFGRTLTLPITQYTTMPIVDDIPQKYGLLNNQPQLGFDRDGVPLALYSRFDVNSNSQVYVARPVPSTLTWNIVQLTTNNYWGFIFNNVSTTNGSGSIANSFLADDPVDGLTMVSVSMIDPYGNTDPNSGIYTFDETTLTNITGPSQDSLNNESHYAPRTVSVNADSNGIENGYTDPAPGAPMGISRLSSGGISYSSLYYYLRWEALPSDRSFMPKYDLSGHFINPPPSILHLYRKAAIFDASTYGIMFKPANGNVFGAMAPSTFGHCQSAEQTGCGRRLAPVRALVQAPSALMFTGVRAAQRSAPSWFSKRFNHEATRYIFGGRSKRIQPTQWLRLTRMLKRTVRLFAIAELLKGTLTAGELLQSLVGNPGVSWPATDSLGRTLPLAAEVGQPRMNRQVGIFYFLNHHHRPVIYDIAKILTENPNAGNEPHSPLWGGFHTPHFWGQPLFGYYLSDDAWVLRRHAQLLADAGVDTLIFDTTNGNTLKEEYTALCEVFAAMRRQGERTPQICFMVNTKAGETAQELYDKLYKPGLYSNLWYRWQGKPLLICDPKEASPAVRKFFTLRRAHWPFTMVNTPYAWHWEDAYPQPYGFTTNRNKAEMINVSIAQNLRVKDGKVTDMSNDNARGRSFHNGHLDTSPGAINLGLNFQEQWNRALALDPPFVMITGWNEWNTSRFDDPAAGKSVGRVKFIDQFGPEYSRDVEPMRGGFADNYYYQMVANIRRYKGVPSLPVGGAPQTISIAGSFDQWKLVEPEFRDHSNETKPRDYFDVAGKPITNHTGRNDLISMKVTGDEQNLYFYVRTREPITPSTNAAGLWLLLDTDQNYRTGWHGYDFIINREAGCVERNAGGWNWKLAGRIEIRIAGNELQMAIPRAILGLNQKSSFDFKWADNLPQPCDIMDFYSDGDVAPEGRFNFRFIAP